MSEPLDRATLTKLTAEIVTSYVRHQDVAPGDVARMIASVGQELAAAGREASKPAKPEPAVPIGRSVQSGHIVCLVCGRKLRTLRRHLTSAHSLTPQAYRESFGLKANYPMIAPAASQERAAIARRTGLGQRRPPEPARKAKARPTRRRTR